MTQASNRRQEPNKDGTDEEEGKDNQAEESTRNTIPLGTREATDPPAANGTGQLAASYSVKRMLAFSKKKSLRYLMFRLKIEIVI